MREIRQSGSEGGGNESNHFSLPLSVLSPRDSASRRSLRFVLCVLCFLHGPREDTES
jgi:hypothetical protein